MFESRRACEDILFGESCAVNLLFSIWGQRAEMALHCQPQVPQKIFICKLLESAQCTRSDSYLGNLKARDELYSLGGRTRTEMQS